MIQPRGVPWNIQHRRLKPTCFTAGTSTRQGRPVKSSPFPNKTRSSPLDDSITYNPWLPGPLAPILIHSPRARQRNEFPDGGDKIQRRSKRSGMIHHRARRSPAPFARATPSKDENRRGHVGTPDHPRRIIAVLAAVRALRHPWCTHRATCTSLTRARARFAL